MSHAAQILTHRRYRRRHLIVFGGLLLMGLWGAAWGMTAYRLSDIVEELSQTPPANEAQGATFHFADRYIDGTPLTVHIHLKNPSLQHPNGHKLQAGEAVIYLPLWNWHAVSAKLRDGITGQWGANAFAFEALKLGFEKPEETAIGHQETGISVWVSALGVTPRRDRPFALGEKIDELSFDLRVMGPPPDFTRTQAVRDWNEGSGVFEVDRLTLRWGPLFVAAKGTLALSPDLQPEGAFSGRVEGLTETIDLFRMNDLLPESREKLLRASLNVLSRPSGVTGGSAPILPISVQEGGLFLGPVRMLDIPPLVWP